MPLTDVAIRKAAPKAEVDPTAALRGAIKRVKHKHHAAITDPAEIGQLLRDIDGFTGQPVTYSSQNVRAQ